MLNPNKLRQKTQEAAERIALERQREEKRLQQEAEARRLENERQREEELRQQQMRKLATQTWAAIVKQSIQTAAQGGRSIQLEVPSDLVDMLQAEVTRLGLGPSMTFKTIFTSNWGLTLQRRLNVLAEKIRSTPYAEDFMGKLTIGQLPSTKSALNNLGRNVSDLLAEMAGATEDEVFSEKERRFLLSDDARTYINLHLKPHLAADVSSTLVAKLEVSWRPIDVLRVVISALHDVPSWLLSNGGSGLIERIGQCMGVDADQGKNASIFELYPLPINPDRWGQNAMMKFVHDGQPIGVCPLAPEVFAQAVSYLGFKAAVGTAPTGPTLTLRW